MVGLLLSVSWGLMITVALMLQNHKSGINAAIMSVSIAIIYLASILGGAP